jgi:hypothetical protein
MKINTILTFLIAIVGALLLSACSQTVGHFTPVAATNPNNTVFYIYRPEASTPGVMKPLKYDYPEVLIDGKSIGVLKYDEYLVTELTSGVHKITITGLTTASSGWAERDIEQAISIGQNKQVFMRLRVEYDLNNMNLGQPGAKYIIQLTPVDAENAKYQIRDTNRSKN